MKIKHRDLINGCCIIVGLACLPKDIMDLNIYGVIVDLFIIIVSTQFNRSIKR